MRVPSGTPLMNVSAASRDASERVGDTSVDDIEPDVSMHSTTAASCTGSVATSPGFASAAPPQRIAITHRAVKSAFHGGALPAARSRKARLE